MKKPAKTGPARHVRMKKTGPARPKKASPKKASKTETPADEAAEPPKAKKPADKPADPPKVKKPADEPEPVLPEAPAMEQVEAGYWQVMEDEEVEPDQPRDIYFGVLKPGAPPEVQDLKSEIERVLSTLRLIYGAESKQAKYDSAFDRLLSLARVGLQGETPAVFEAKAALEALKMEIVNREAGVIKNGYMITLGSWALGFGLGSILLYFICDQYPWLPPKEVYNYRHVFLVWAACMAGAWASFASRKVVLGFFDLSNLEEDRVDPALRLIFAAVLTTVLVLVFATGFANVVVGGFDASKLLESGSVAMLIGAFAGLSEQALPAAMMQRAKTFISGSEGGG